MSASAQLSVGIRNFADTPPADWRHLLDQARAADDAGIDRVFLNDHLVFGSDLSAYGDPRTGGRVGGVQPTGPDGDWLEPLTVLAAMAAITNRVRLATNVLVAPIRPPVLLAKVAATLDVLSHGRFELGVGTGWQEAEFRAVGIDFATRGHVLDELLAACRELWTAAEGTLVTDRFSLAGVHMMPKPTTEGGVPIWIGGSPITNVARRLARYGAGWIPWGTTPENFPELLARMRGLVAAQGRDFSTIQVCYPIPTILTSERRLDLDAMFEPVPTLLAAGISDFRLMPRLPAGYPAARELLEQLSRAFHSVTGQPDQLDNEPAEVR